MKGAGVGVAEPSQGSRGEPKGAGTPPGVPAAAASRPALGLQPQPRGGPAAPRSQQIAAAPLASSACPSPFSAGLATTEEAQIDGFTRSSWQCPSWPGREQRLLLEVGSILLRAAGGFTRAPSSQPSSRHSTAAMCRDSSSPSPSLGCYTRMSNK